MECVVFEFVLDFELEKASSAKSLEIYILLMAVNLFADLSMVTTAKHLWSTSRYDLCNLVEKQ